MVPLTFTNAPFCPLAPVPLMLSASLTVVIPPCNCKVAPLATVVPDAIVPSALAFWIFRIPEVTLVAPS